MLLCSYTTSMYNIHFCIFLSAHGAGFCVGFVITVAYWFYFIPATATKVVVTLCSYGPLPIVCFPAWLCRMPRRVLHGIVTYGAFFFVWWCVVLLYDCFSAFPSICECLYKSVFGQGEGYWVVSVFLVFSVFKVCCAWVERVFEWV